MKTIFRNKRISGILGVLPQNVSYFDDEVNNYSFPPKQTMRLKKIMGYQSHRLSKETSFASDFCLYGIRYLLERKYIKREEIGAILVVTISPDYFLPQISNILQGELDFPEEVICLDIAQGCCGYLIGLTEAFMLLEHLKDKKVLLCNVDVLSKKVSKQDRNDFPLIGDGAAITLVENTFEKNEIPYIMHMDGKRRSALWIPAGGFRQPNSKETGELKDAGDGNRRALDHMYMDGTAVFSFVQEKVPGLIKELMDFANLSDDGIDYYLFHQPNKFMLQKLAEKLKIPEEKIFMNLVEKYGNPSGASIPLTTVENLSAELKKESFQCCLSAFGSGLAWGAMLVQLGYLDFCEMLESDL